METVGGDGSETGLVVKKKGKQKINDRYAVPASPRTAGIKRRATTICISLI